MIRACDRHSYFDGSQCPTCGARGRAVLEDDRRTRLSKFMSGVLRHFPTGAGLELDDRGWVRSAELAAAAERQYGWAGREHVEAVAATDPKGRFERRDGQIRAAYGHSIDVDVGADADPAEVPALLYHGTAPENLESILADGLEPMARNRVHLSGTVDGAREVGLRHADDPVVLEVDAPAMLADGYSIQKRGPETFTTERVPPRYFSVLDEQ